ncbi:UDP-3-O-(3-hydroxymyristoyl)glucosamine N-acyltransferase [Seleniivibrio sp.]|uniref:UDP-3-O-(3-hydroxymyristoyl)glucosamine N-acyltransferase n=1 Tax=Seleniivibrio sp. TaxID=2898801 RepID=UPI0025F87B7A|nr:UDP-3-O-(3-hydroxymyristoyl)glucosamine N-acyltransferase [Seleniivibrio sp.]MCD8555024.1 UDP-3-O-(3-hydroxymyristoyl)glucosamine N-acyltransferase [Seleniivibrio sp.]
MKASVLAEKTGGKLIGADTEVSCVSSFEEIREGALVPLLVKELPEGVLESKAAAFLVKTGSETASGKTYIEADDPEMALVAILGLVHQRPVREAGIHLRAYVAESAEIGQNVFIDAFAYVGENCRIGDNCIIRANVTVDDGVVMGEGCEIFPNVSLYSGTKLGNRVIIHSGAVIGADGFGYYQRGGKNVKIPHVGGVMLCDDVEIGANSCVDRGKFSDTVIGESTKIDNQCMVGHNCVLGKSCIMAGQAALAGSTTLGDYVVMGARSGAADHLNICSKTMLAGQCGVISDIDKPGIYAGFPHTSRKGWLREVVLLRSLPDTIKRIDEIERKLNDDGH